MSYASGRLGGETAYPSNQVISSRNSTSTTETKTGEPFLPRYNVDQEVELIRLGEGFCNVCTRQCTAFIRVCNNECTRCDFGYKNCACGSSELEGEREYEKCWRAGVERTALSETRGSAQAGPSD